MSVNLDIPNVLPDLFTIDDPATGSKSVLRKNLMEIPAMDKVTFEPVNQKNIRFKICSVGDFLIGRESYIKFNLQVNNLVAFDPDFANDQLPRQSHWSGFGIGGAHNLFRNIQIRTLGRGVLLQEIDHYNIYQGLEHQLNMSRAYIAEYGPMYADNSVPKQSIGCDGFWANEGTITNVGVILLVYGNTYSVDLGSAALLNMIQGKIFAIYDTASGKADYFRHVAEDVGTAFVAELLSGSPLTVGAIPANAKQLFVYSSKGKEYGLVKPSSGIMRLEDMTADQVTIEICFQPFLTLLQHNIPLNLLKDGLELILELDSPQHAFVSTRSQISYTITDPKFMGMMVTPHPDIQERYESMWRTDKGLIYRIPSVRVRQRNEQHGTNTNLQFNVGARSAMKAVLIQTDSAIENEYLYDRTMSMQMGVTAYQWKVGSINFPNREVDMTGHCGEAYKQLLMAFDRYGETNLLLDSTQYGGGNSNGIGHVYPLDATLANNITDAYRTYIGVDFRRINGYGDNLSGIDLSNVTLDLELKRTNNSNAKLGGKVSTSASYYLFVWYDSYLKINSQQVTVLS